MMGEAAPPPKRSDAVADSRKVLINQKEEDTTMAEKKNVYEIITDRIIDELQKGNIP